MHDEKIYELLGKVLEIESNQLKEMPRDTHLLKLGLDSLSFIQLVAMIETEFKFEFEDSDLLLHNFETIEHLFSTINRYKLEKNSVKKVLVCDCDDVLWKGVAGEEDIYLDDDTIALQNKLVELYNKGVLLCLCTKNESFNIDYAFSTLDMPLKQDHIIQIRANQDTKSNNIQSIARELRLSINSCVFIDDSDYEIGLINVILPDLDTIKVDYTDVSFIQKLDLLFYNSSIGANRTQQYREQKEREKIKVQFSSVQEYNESLETITIIGEATESQAARVSELSLRTNRFNLSQKRYSQEDIIRLLSQSEYMIYTMHARDKYGDMGIVGAAVVNMKQELVEAFFLSCRVIGRDFEKILISHIRHNTSQNLCGLYVESDSNAPFKNFYSSNGLKTVSDERKLKCSL